MRFMIQVSPEKVFISEFLFDVAGYNKNLLSELILRGGKKINLYYFCL